jgi:hypothetical protein
VGSFLSDAAVGSFLSDAAVGVADLAADLVADLLADFLDLLVTGLVAVNLVIGVRVVNFLVCPYYKITRRILRVTMFFFNGYA